MLIKAIDGSLEKINRDVEVSGDAQLALNQILRIKAIHQLTKKTMLIKERIHEKDGQYVVDWGGVNVFSPDANVVFNLTLDIESQLHQKASK